MKEERDWLDYAGILLLPAVIGFGGLWYGWKKDDGEAQRHEWEMDASYVKDLASVNETEQRYGSLMINAVSSKKKFPPDLFKIVIEISKGRPSSPATQGADQFIRSATGAGPTALAPTGAASSGTRVYFEFAKECQREEANALQAKFPPPAFLPQGVELVPGGTVHTYVRFFDPSTASVARSANQMLTNIGYHAEVQDFSREYPGQKQIEIWLGGSEGRFLTGNTPGVPCDALASK
jgi:hypothetical protein